MNNILKTGTFVLFESTLWFSVGSFESERKERNLSKRIRHSKRLHGGEIKVRSNCKIGKESSRKKKKKRGKETLTRDLPKVARRKLFFRGIKTYFRGDRVPFLRVPRRERSLCARRAIHNTEAKPRFQAILNFLWYPRAARRRSFH